MNFMKKTLSTLGTLSTHILLTLMLLGASLTVFPSAAHAADEWYSGFVKCDGVVETERRIVGKDNTGAPIYDEVQINPDQVKCDFRALVNTIMTFITWFMGFSVTLCVALFSYAGILYMTANEKNIATAKGIFYNVAIGFIVILIAWTLIYTLVNWIVKPEFLSTVTSFLAK